MYVYDSHPIAEQEINLPEDNLNNSMKNNYNNYSSLNNEIKTNSQTYFNNN